MRTITTIGDLTVQYAQHWVTMGEREVKLAQRERGLLAALAQNARRVVPRIPCSSMSIASL
ncbi:MAG TPA: hypothetical protein VF844_02085 [Ktedonobacteraceae bacterium]